MLYLICKLTWRVACASTGLGESHPWWEPGLWAVALGKELSSSLALLFTSSDSGTAWVYSVALPEDSERNCAMVLRKQIVLENRRSSTRSGSSEPHSTWPWSVSRGEAFTTFLGNLFLFHRPHCENFLPCTIQRNILSRKERNRVLFPTGSMFSISA